MYFILILNKMQIYYYLLIIYIISYIYIKLITFNYYKYFKMIFIIKLFNLKSHNYKNNLFLK